MELILFIVAIFFCNQVNTFATDLQPLEETAVIEYIQPVDIYSDTIYTDIPLAYDVDNSAKPYMDYRTITDKTSKQWEYIHSMGVISVNSKGFLVTEDKFIGVAMGSYFGKIGAKYIITLDTGIELQVVKVEEKADIHTCDNNYMSTAQDIIEFVIDTKTDYMQGNIWANGYIFQGNFNNCPDFQGDIVKIVRVDDVISSDK